MSVDTTTQIPYAITDPALVPVERYYSREFAQLENERLWNRVWQVACREEDIPRIGDFIEYEINQMSLLVVRVDQDTIKAFHNACRHRATQLGSGSGQFLGRQIVCPYHGWRWNLDGSNSYVYAERGFKPPCVDPEYLRLREVPVGVALGMVWINPDTEAEPFETAWKEAVDTFAPIGFDRMRVRWWKSVVLDANWKMAQEAFMEAYHVMQAHPSLAMGAADEDYDIDVLSPGFEMLEGGHSHAPTVSTGVPVRGMPLSEYFINFNNALYHGTDAYATEREMFIQSGLIERDIPDEKFPLAFFQALYEYAKGAGIQLPPPAKNTTGYGHIFPNITFLPAYGNSIIYRSRPYGDDPERCLFEVWAVQIPAEDEHPEQPVLESEIPVDDWPQILKEDYHNIIKQQKGLHSADLPNLVMSEKYEAMIVNHHRVLDEYLRRP